MIETVVVAIAALAAAVYIARPLASAIERAPAETSEADAALRKERALEAILDLEAELAAGKLSADDFAAFKIVHERDAIAAMRELDVAAASEGDALEAEIAAVRARLR